MDSSESLHLDEHLARLLAAYDHGLEEADGRAPTIDVRPFLQGERPVEPLSGSGGAPNQGSLNDLLPDASRGDPFTPASAPTPETHRVGRFELRKQLGRGGCGIVFLAHDPKLKRDVALKIPRPELLMSPDARKRLVREATAAAVFDHPNLVPVYETGEIGPVCYIATVFCPGLTLSEWLDRQAFPVPVRQAARLVAQLAEAVQHAHDRGVLHRDLKPNNVILQDVKQDVNQQDAPPGACPLRGDYFIPRVVDFGLAKLADSGPGETATRQVLGTPKYMAPEQAQARHEDVGPEADVYALGGILYEMLTGRAPYEGATDVDVLRQCIDGNLTPPRHLRKDIPRDLEAICIKALARYATRRYRSAIDFADDLRRFLDGLPTLARPLNGLGRASRWLRRNDQLFALVTVTTISVVLLASGVWSAYRTQKLQTSRDESALRETARIRDEYDRQYAKGARDAFHSWRAGQREAMIRSLQEAKAAIGFNSASPEFSLNYLTFLSRRKPVVVADSEAARSVAASPGGTWLASAHADGTIKLWKRDGLKLESKTTAKPGVSLAFHSEQVLLARSGSTVQAWNISDGWKPEEVKAGAVPASLDVAKDGSAIALRDGRTLRGTSGPIRVARLSPDGTHVAAIGPGPALATWNLTDDTHHVHRDFAAELHDLAWSPDSRTLHLAAENGLHVLDAAADPAGATLRDRHAAIVDFAIRPESEEHVVAYSDGVVESFASRGVVSKRYPSQGRRALAVVRMPAKGPAVAAEVRDDSVIVWQFGETAKLLLRQPVRASAVDINLGGEFLAVAEPNGTVRVWTIATGELAGTVDSRHGHAPRRIALSENGRWLALPVEGSRLGFWFVGEQAVSLKVPGHAEGTTTFRFLGDDKVATAGRGSSIKVWNLTGAKEEWTLLGHAAPVTSFACSTDQRTLASGDAKGEVKLWDLRSGEELVGLVRHRGPVSALEFASDGRRLLSGSAFRDRGELAFWDAVKD